MNYLQNNKIRNHYPNGRYAKREGILESNQLRVLDPQMDQEEPEPGPSGLKACLITSKDSLCMESGKARYYQQILSM